LALERFFLLYIKWPYSIWHYILSCAALFSLLKEFLMDYVKLGRTGLEVSRICLGCMSYGVKDRGAHTWTLPEEESREHIKHALDLGINFFDTANVYSDGTSEEIVGKALNDFTKRENVVLATKVHGRMRPGPNGAGLSRKAIMQEADASLKRLGVDYIDLWQFAKALQLAERHGWTRFVSMQNYVNLIYREEEREMLPLCKEEGVGVIPWSPLARGRLTRDLDESTERAQTDEFGKKLYAKTEGADRAVIEQVAKLAKERGVPRAQIALAWVLSKPVVTAPIIGATKPHHLEDAIASLSVKLSPDELALLEKEYVPHPVLGFS
jgi:aryl-alcohol dehydrogenase-like predicted oxidoreductase